MGNYCTRRRDTISYRRYQARINAGRPQAVTGGRNREDIRRNLRENGYVGFEYIFRHSNRAVERGPEHSMIIANAENVPAPVDENSENSRPFAENRFNEDIFRRPIVHEIPDDDVESTGLHRLPPHPMQGLDYNVISYKVPIFLTPFVNLKSGVKLQLKFYASSVGYKTLKVYGEAAFLFTHLRGLTLYYLCNKEDSKMEPNVLLEENHGRLRRRNMKLRKRRHMKVRYRMMKKQSFLIIAGKDFLLRLQTTEPSMSMESLRDSNGEMPLATGTYTRLLDTNPNIVMDWQVFMWRWFNEKNEEILHF